MSGDDRTDAALSRLARISTELAARRELRDRAAQLARARSRANLQAIGYLTERTATRLTELGRSQSARGGWRKPVIHDEPDDDDLSTRSWMRGRGSA